MAITGNFTTLTCLAALLLAPAAGARTIVDATGDFLPSFAGPANPDLDVESITLVRDASSFRLGATLAGAIGTTTGAIYVWGIDRGLGTARFTAGSPSVGAGVLFDSVLILRPNRTGNFVDLITPANNFTLDPSAISISGRDLSARLAFASVPSTGFSVADYGFNLWPRAPITGNTGIADFAPDDITATAAVPEPASWALLIVGFGIAGAMLRRRGVLLAQLAKR